MPTQLSPEDSRNNTADSAPIAVVGRASLFPEFWTKDFLNSIEEAYETREIPFYHRNRDEYVKPIDAEADFGKTHLLSEFPAIDRYRYGPVSKVFSTLQALTFRSAEEALVDAGYVDLDTPIRKRTGIILGVSDADALISSLGSSLDSPIWEKGLKDSGLSDQWLDNSFPSMLGNMVAGQIANRLGLGGINCVVNAGRASLLSAVMMATSELSEGRTDMMITGGLWTNNSIFLESLLPSHLLKHSHDAMENEGIVMMVLKRLEDARRDGDRIYASIEVLSDRGDKSIHPPPLRGQERVLNPTYKMTWAGPSATQSFMIERSGTIAGNLGEIVNIHPCQAHNGPTITLIKQVQKGHHGAKAIVYQDLNHEYDRYVPKIAKSIRQKCWNSEHCEDVIQETFYRFLESLWAGKYECQRASPVAYLKKMAHNIIVDNWRRRGQYTLVSLYQTGADGEEQERPLSIPENDIDAQIDNEQMLRDIESFIDQLDERQIVIFQLFIIGEKKAREVSHYLTEIWGIETSERNVRRIAHNIRKMIKKTVGQKWGRF